MALIYTKLTDKTTVLAPRQGACRKFNFGTDWTEVRVGLFASAVAATGSNDPAVVENLTPSTAYDYVTFGIKDDSANYPGQAGALFLGIRGAGDTTSSASGGIGDPSGNWRPVGYDGLTAVIGASNAGSGTNAIGAALASGASNYAAFIGLRIVLNNRGLSSQSVNMYMSTQPVAGTDYSADALRTLLNNSFGGGSGALASIAWNDGAAARAIPDCVWVRTPLFNNSLRLSAVRAIRYAP